MISADIRKQIKAGENAGTAFVLDPRDTDRIAAVVCSFLNTDGGVVFVGVDADGIVAGVDGDPEAARRTLELDLQDRIAPKALFTLSIDTEDDRPIISIEAPQGRDQPYVVDGQVFVRRGKRTAQADPTELRQSVLGRSVEPIRWERRPSIGLSVEDIDLVQIEDTTREATQFGRLKFRATEDVDATLRELSLLVPAGYTHACDVLFAKRPSARHPQCRVRFLRYASDKTGADYLEDQWVQGPLVQVYNALIDLVSRHVRVQSHFAPGEHMRQDYFNYSIEAVREGIVNALAHRDYAAFSGGLSVSVYPSRIEIWNSGRLPAEIKIGDLKKLHPSIPTNPDITHVLYLRRLMERAGRGTQKIIAACLELRARAPKWQDLPSGVTLTIYAAGDSEGAQLNARQARALEQLRPGDFLKLRDYMAELDLPERTARRDLSELQEFGFLKRVGRGPATTYQRTERTV